MADAGRFGGEDLCFWRESFIIWVTCIMRIAYRKEMMSTMTSQELCILLESLLALPGTNNCDKAKTVIENASGALIKARRTRAGSR